MIENEGMWVKNQLIMVNSALAAAIVVLFMVARNISSPTELAMVFAATITSFYFWWGSVFLAIKGMVSTKIMEYLYDFLIIILLIGLFYIVGLEAKDKAIIWLINYFVLFIAIILKYIFMLMSKKNSKFRGFLKKKIRIDISASVIIAIFLIIVIILRLELFAIWGIFFMELIHIIYVGFFTKFYEKF